MTIPEPAGRRSAGLPRADVRTTELERDRGDASRPPTPERQPAPRPRSRPARTKRERATRTRSRARPTFQTTPTRPRLRRHRLRIPPSSRRRWRPPRRRSEQWPSSSRSLPKQPGRLLSAALSEAVSDDLPHRCSPRVASGTRVDTSGLGLTTGALAARVRIHPASMARREPNHGRRGAELVALEVDPHAAQEFAPTHGAFCLPSADGGVPRRSTSTAIHEPPLALSLGVSNAVPCARVPFPVRRPVSPVPSTHELVFCDLRGRHLPSPA